MEPLATYNSERNVIVVDGSHRRFDPKEVPKLIDDLRAALEQHKTYMYGPRQPK